MSHPSAAPRTVDVLVVDDDPALCRVIARYLGKHQRSTMAAPSALHALRILERRPVRLVLSDLNMPGPLGTALLETVERRWPHVRRVLMSGDTSGAVVNRTTSAHRILDKVSFLQLIAGVLDELENARPESTD